MSEAQSPQLQSQIAQWRARCAGIGEPMTQDEYREAIKLLRAGRVSASTASAVSRTRKAKAEVPSSDDLLDAL